MRQTSSFRWSLRFTTIKSRPAAVSISLFSPIDNCLIFGVFNRFVHFCHNFMQIFVPQPIEYILRVISNDFQETGECRMQVAKEGFMNFMASFALAKGSRYTNLISQGYGYAFFT